MKDTLIKFATTKINKVGDTDANSNTNDVNLATNIKDIIVNIIAVLGLVCVVVMIIGGVNYMTSSGDSAKVEKAKKTILYGCIGLVICALSFAIVNFVITDILK